MAVTVTTEGLKVSVKLDDGLTVTGAKKTVNLPFPALNTAAFDAEKVMAIVAKLNNVLTKAVYRVIKVENSNLDSDE